MKKKLAILMVGVAMMSFIIGLVVGANLGLILFGILNASKN